MTQQTGAVDTAAKIKDLEEENELLLLQLHQVQEELEVYFLKYKDLEAGRGSSTQPTAGANIVWVDDELPEALAELERLKTLAHVQAEIKEIESRNALNVKLGNMLLESSSSVGGISKIPFALLGFWRTATSKNIPAALGGKEFAGVIKAYEERGFVGVKSILKEDGLSPIVRANAYTALARHLMRRDAKGAAEAASKAFETDPKAYRLKWLAFKMHDAGDLAKAEAMLDLLPLDTKFSDSEERQVKQLRYEAKNARQRHAKQKTSFSESRAQVMGQIDNLTRELNQQTQLATESQQTIEDLQHAQAKLNADKAALTRQRDQQTHLAAERERAVEALEQKQKQLEAEMVRLVRALDESTLLADVRRQELENLASQHTESLQSLSKELDSAGKTEKFLRNLLEQEQVKNLGLVQARHEMIVQIESLEDLIQEAAQLAEVRRQEIEALSQSKAQVETEKANLAVSLEETAQLAEARRQEIEALSQSKAQVEADKAGLTGALEEAAQLAEARRQEIEALSQAKAQVEADKAGLTGALEEAAQLAEARRGRSPESAPDKAGLTGPKPAVRRLKR
ncbi:hypothetical protein [Fluviibacter phosphoraccumulans]|uniref:Uncharacterized protein n=1 Tax=Fluviibacter phosphoraccumulans TaxID=1751046 RepID=A0A7R6TQQ0_9RHOO|nr:hypothetical protein [Fluviibacter phosphoraccumulans]BBU69668.1 hypothetical protein ICHIAU1_19510 [Fluviibacter phosphoraccumulans]